MVQSPVVVETFAQYWLPINAYNWVVKHEPPFICGNTIICITNWLLIDGMNDGILNLTLNFCLVSTKYVEKK